MTNGTRETRPSMALIEKWFIASDSTALPAPSRNRGEATDRPAHTVSSAPSLYATGVYTTRDPKSFPTPSTLSQILLPFLTVMVDSQEPRCLSFLGRGSDQVGVNWWH